MEELLKPYKEIGTKLRDAKKKLSALRTQFIQQMKQARTELDEDECSRISLEIIKEKLDVHLGTYVSEHARDTIEAVQNWWCKYHDTLIEMEIERDNAKKELSVIIGRLNYE